jgi:NAD-dependent dihydropyrimidine dehydrogenase PreA subunit
MGVAVRYLTEVVSLKLDKDKCCGCGRCAEVCPRRVFALHEKKAEIVFRDNCIECGACQRNCAPGAVTVNAGVGCAQALFRAALTGGEPVCGCNGEAKQTSGCC